MTIQIPWSKQYICEWFIFKFVPKIWHYIDKNGNTWIEKNNNVKFKIYQ